MNFEEFSERLMEATKERLSERGQEVEVKTTFVEKMNESYNSMVVMPEGYNVGMNIDLDTYFGIYQDGVGFNEIVERVVDVVEKHIPEMPKVNVGSSLSELT